MLIYLYVNSAFGSVASLDFGVFRGSLLVKPQTLRYATQPGYFIGFLLREHNFVETQCIASLLRCACDVS